MPVNLFDRQRLIQLHEVHPRTPTFFARTFFPGRRTFNTETIKFDVMRGTRIMAPYSHRDLPAPTKAKLGYTTKYVSPPTIQEKVPTTAAHLYARDPGSHPYAEREAERAAENDARELRDMARRADRQINLACARALITGQIPIVGEGVNETIDFGRPGANDLGLIDAADRWSANTSDPIAWLTELFDFATEQGLDVPPTHIILGREAAAAFIANEAVREASDLLRMSLVSLEPRYERFAGIRVLGRLAGVPCDILVSLDTYVDPANVGAGAQPFVPPRSVTICSAAAENEIHFGAVAVSDPDSGTLELVEGEEVLDGWVDKEPAQAWIKRTTRPVPVVLHPETTVTAEVLAP